MTSAPKDAERLAEVRIGGTHLCQHHIMAAACGLCERDATIARLCGEIEDWRGRLATQCGETLAARQERDSYKQASLDCHDALGKCAVERDTATRRIEALEAEVGRLQQQLVRMTDRWHASVAMGVEADKEIASLRTCKETLQVAAPPAGAVEQAAQDDSRLRRSQPAADHTERARVSPANMELYEAFYDWLWDRDPETLPPTEIAAALADIAGHICAAAERAGAEKMRALDEALIAAAREVKSFIRIDAIMEGPARKGIANRHGLLDAIYALDDALAARDAATDGEGR